MTLEITKGPPPVEGQYVCFVNGDDGYVQAKMLTWHGGRWHYWRHVYAWIGPIPVMRISDFDEPEPAQTVDVIDRTTEYDL